MFETPSFWYDTTSPAARTKATALAGASALYTLGHLAHQMTARPRRAGVPVVCVGNIVAGGGGKTPTALMLMTLIRQSGIATNPCFLSRGYGGSLRGPVAVDPKTHTAAVVGDEPLLLAAAAPTIVSKNRLKGALFAAQAGHDLVVMDDGLQNTSLHRDFSLLVIDGQSGFGNEMMLPAGPLRTPIHRGLWTADAVLLIGDDDRNVLRHIPANLPVFKGTIAPRPPGGKATRYHAFCGIAHPDKFRKTLAACGLTIAGFTAWPDHHPYTRAEFSALQDRAGQDGARLITTAKDSMRLCAIGVADDAYDILPIDFTLPADQARDLSNALLAHIRRG